SDVKELDVAMSNTFDTNYNHSNKNHNNQKQDNQTGRGSLAGEEKQYNLSLPRDVIQYFCERYRNQYFVNYNPVWSRDMSWVKKNLLSAYSPVQIKTIIDTIFQEYD
ncbi:hypothetical protein, partial [Heliobacterium chlorum]|uniref:hypothetical protein n=1 Tax=Heliobacterium chlorum TaxID=2698 RepID=UPI001A9B466B